jgi:hypothetical protein
VVEGRAALAVGDVDVGAVADEGGDDLLMPRAAVGEDDRFEQRGPSRRFT